MSQAERKIGGLHLQSLEELTLLQEKSNRLHEMFMLIVVIFCLVYTGVDIWLGQLLQAAITFSTIFFTGISFILYKKKKFLISKVWNMASITVIIQIIVITVGIDSYSFIFFIPLLMGNLFIFQGKEAKFGYVLVFIDALLMTNSMLFLDDMIALPTMSKEMADLDGFMNLLGVSLVCIAETYFIVQVTDSIHRKLISRTRALNLKNEQLISTLYTRDRMMSVLSHDLRSPIASLDSAADILQTEGIDPEMQKAILAQFKGRTSSVLELIDKLLLWTRTQTNNIEFVERELSLNEIEDMVKNVCALSSSDKNILYTVNFGASESSKVLGDKDMLETIFRNLISNATKYSRDNGEVQITAQQTPHGWCFRVIDFGVGMSSDFLQKMNVGEVNSTRGTKNEIGHGLGLQLVNDFLHKHESHLMVSTLEGKGSEFYFYLKAV
jgi:signal transduction histidine kinase